MLELVLALVLASAPPAPASSTEAQKAPVADAHDHGQADEKPLDEAGKKIYQLAEMLVAQTRSHIAAFEDMLPALKDPKDCAAVAKAVAAKAKKHEADQTKARDAAEAVRKPMPQGDQNSAAGKAFVSVTGDLKKFRDSLPGYDSSIGVFKGKCPKQGAEVEKLFTAQRKFVSPP
jgi:hypothetical protein